MTPSIALALAAPSPASQLPFDLPAGDGATALWGVLAVLALLDSTSFGTLLIPLWLVMAPGQLRAGRILRYLGVVAGAYLVVGLVLLGLLTVLGDSLLEGISTLRESRAVLIGQLALAAGLIWFSGRLDPWTERGRAEKRRREEARGTAGRLHRFRARAVGAEGHGGTGALAGLALAAVGIEIGTLLPYLAGIGLVAAEAPPAPVAGGMILFYCLVMIAPALGLLLARRVASRTLDRPLGRLEAFLSRHASGTMGVILLLLGIWLGSNALGGLQG